MNNLHCLLVCALSAVVPSLRSQVAVGTQAPPLSASGSSLDPGSGALALDAAWRVPIHSMDEDPEFGRYGVWAAGRGYKVSFHDGMEFVPFLGKEARENVVVRWQTESVTLGGHEWIELGATGRASSEWRYEYRSEGFSEVYDVRSAGLEQSFVIERPAAASRLGGDLVVVGSLSGDLTPRLRPQEGVQASIDLVDAQGQNVVRYGAAFALDASGRRIEIATTLRDGRVALTVPAGFVEDAEWPITIDPLLTPSVVFNPGSGVEYQSSDVAVRLGNSLRRVMTVFSIEVSATDSDAYAVLTDEDFGSRALVFTDLSTSFRTDDPSIAFVEQAGVAGRWVLAFARTTSAVSRIRVYLHEGLDMPMQSGTTLFLPEAVSGRNDRRPDIGGAQIGEQALLAFEADTGISGTVDDLSTVMISRINAETLSITSATQFDPLGFLLADFEWPSVSQNGAGTPLTWLVCAQRRQTIASPWEIVGARRADNGTSSFSATVIASPPGGPTHLVRPSVDGNNTRYLVTALRTNNAAASSGTELVGRRFLWSPTALVPTLQWEVALAEANPILFQTLGYPAVTVNVELGNWAIAFRENNVLLTGDRIRLARVGFNGDIVESATAFSSQSDDGQVPAITFDRMESRFLAAYASDAGMTGRAWTYPVDAQNVSYGTGCGPGSFGAVTRPLVGVEFFRIRLEGAPPNTPAALFVGFSPAAVDLGPLGAPGCSLLVDPGAIVSLGASTDASGDALLTIVGLLDPIDLYMQWLYVDVSANPLGGQLTEGLRSQIR